VYSDAHIHGGMGQLNPARIACKLITSYLVDPCRRQAAK
jgi:hypothetical protein